MWYPFKRNKKVIETVAKVVEPVQYVATLAGQFHKGQKVAALGIRTGSGPGSWDESQYNPQNDFTLFDLHRHEWLNAHIMEITKDGSMMLLAFDFHTQTPPKLKKLFDDVDKMLPSSHREAYYPRWVKVKENNIKALA